MKRTLLIVIAVALAGCGSSLKNSWTNFTAYYNTFYNAKQDFNAGLALVKKQPVQLNPETPVLAHPVPVLAGEEQFESAVDNAAQVLRRFPDSKWTDNALLLMGKSYYYLQEYFLARQKFEEILDLPIKTPLKQQAVIWKGRTLLGVGSFSEGAQFLQDQLADFNGQWKDDNEAEVQILLAEHLAMLANWSEAARLLEEAVPNLEKEPMKGRSYFLWGQMLENTGDLIKAFQVYSNVERYFLDYEYDYWAEMKQAKVSRMGDRNEVAITIYYNMLRDDKSFERRNEIYYQLAQTYQEQGNYRQAEDTFKYILANSTQGSDRQLLSNTYYQLGQLYSGQYSNYNLAAAYFDSSSTLSVQSSAGSGETAGRMALAYNRYIALKQDISRADSLLQLGELSEPELSERLTLLRQQRREAMQESQNAVQQTRNTLANTGTPDEVSATAGPNAGPSAFGFLNYRNKALLQQGRQQFTAEWGQRPLVDNWRRREAILNENVSDTSTAFSTGESEQNGKQVTDDETLGINISDIPRTEEAKERVRNEQLNTIYRLGSLFFLTLNQPDSAATYYQRILSQSPPAELEAQTLYSLHELYKVEQQPDSVEYYRNQILQSYPDTKYAAQILGQNTGQPLENDSTQAIRKKVQQVLTEKGREAPNYEKAEQLRKMAMNESSSPLAAAIFYEAIRESIQFAHYRDSVIAVSDSMAEKATGYTGSHWDKVRNLINEYLELFPDAKQRDRVNTWLNVLKQPEQLAEIPTCEALGIEPIMIPDMESFVKSITLPESVSNMNIAGRLRYRLTITRQGRVEAATLLSNPTGLGIEATYRKAILDRLRFEPIMQNGETVRVNCELEFPIKQSP